MIETIRLAAGDAPAAPGVYFFIDAEDRVVYVGKATNIRQRLLQHATTGVEPRSHLHRRYEVVRSVRWEVTADEEAAAWREGDLIFALEPPFNAETTPKGRSPFSSSRPAGGFVVVGDAAIAVTGVSSWPDGGRVYGLFPHLSKGVATRIGVACSDGYVALLRLLWAASGEGSAMPRAITRSVPPTFDQAVADRPGLHRFLAGTSPRVLDSLLAEALTRRPDFMAPALQRDHSAALGFYRSGPQRLRALRRRHGVAGQVVEAPELRALLRSEALRG